MSTPVDLNIVMPYGATMVGDGTQYAKLAKPHPKQNGGSSLNLPDGPCRVAASWAGNPDTVSVNMYEGRNFVRTLGKIQAGGGGRSWRTSARRLGSSCNAFLRLLSQQARQALSKCSPPTSSCSYPQGGGVNDHPKHRCGLRRAAGNSVVRSGDRGRERQSDRRGQLLPSSAGGRFHHHGQRGAVEPGRASSNHGFIVGTVSLADNISGADACVVERCSSRWRDALPAYQGKRCLRRGRNGHHLAAHLVVQGVAA